MRLRLTQLLPCIAVLTFGCEFGTLAAQTYIEDTQFEPNQGQFMPEALYVWKGHHWQIEFRRSTLVVRRDEGDSFSLEFVNSSPRTAIVPEEHSGAVSNYIIGNDVSRWISVRGYRRLVYENTYPGISVGFYAGKTGPEFDIDVNPGANPEDIRWRVQQNAHMGKNGTLRIGSSLTPMLLKAPYAYQVTGQGRRRIPCRFVILPRHEFGVLVGNYDHNRPLIIDPEIDFSSYFGGSSQNIAGAALYDSQGNLVFVGSTNSADYPTMNSIQPYRGNGSLGSNIVVTKLDPSGKRILFSTYLGGTTNSASGNAVALDGHDSIYIAGGTDSSDFPTTTGVFQPHPKTLSCSAGTSSGPCEHTFIAKIDPVSGQLLYSTYLSGSETDVGLGVAVDASGNAYVGGYTASTDFPVTSGFQSRFGGGAQDGFVSMLSPDGSLLVASTFLGGNSGDAIFGLTLDPAGNVVLAGGTASNDFPVAQSFQQSLAGKSDAFVTVLSPQLDKLRFSSFLGGTDSDFATGVAIDGSGMIYVAGSTLSRDFPVSTGAVQTAYSGGDSTGLGDGFIAKIDPGQHSIVYSSYIGGSGGEEVHSLGADFAGDSTVLFTTSSQSLPVVSALQDSYPSGGFFHSYLATFRPNGKTLSFASYLGGNGEDAATALAVSPCGAVTPFLGTSSTNLPIVNGLYANAPSPYNSIFFAEIGGGQDFAIGAFPNTINLAPNSAASATLTLRSCGGYVGTVQLSCSGVPAGVSCAISTPSIELKASQNIQLTITSTARAEATTRLGFENIFPVLLSVLLVFPLGRSRSRVLFKARLFIFIVVLTCVGMVSCGGGTKSSSRGSPSNSTITITASSGSLIHTTQIALETQ